MDCRVKPGNDGEADDINSNAAPVPGLDFFKGRRDRPSRFPSPPTRGMERREAPGACETPLGCLRGTPWRAFRYRLAGRARFARPCPGRDPSDVGACASRRSTAVPEGAASGFRRGHLARAPLAATDVVGILCYRIKVKRPREIFSSFGRGVRGTGDY